MNKENDFLIKKILLVKNKIQGSRAAAFPFFGWARYFIPGGWLALLITGYQWISIRGGV
jgi:hypothetical protein